MLGWSKRKLIENWQAAACEGIFFCECKRSNNNLNYIISNDSIIIIITSENDSITQLKPIIFRHNILTEAYVALRKKLLLRGESLFAPLNIYFFHTKKLMEFPKTKIIHQILSIFLSPFCTIQFHWWGFWPPRHIPYSQKNILHFNIFFLTFFVCCLNSQNEKLI